MAVGHGTPWVTAPHGTRSPVHRRLTFSSSEFGSFRVNQGPGVDRLPYLHVDQNPKVRGPDSIIRPLWQTRPSLFQHHPASGGHWEGKYLLKTCVFDHKPTEGNVVRPTTLWWFFLFFFFFLRPSVLHSPRLRQRHAPLEQLAIVQGGTVGRHRELACSQLQLRTPWRRV